MNHEENFDTKLGRKLGILWLYYKTNQIKLKVTKNINPHAPKFSRELELKLRVDDL